MQKNQSYLIIQLVLITLANCAIGQVNFQYDQYMYNQYVINPAYAGSSEALEITTSIRKQWLGIEGSPFSQTFTAHSPLRNKNIGLGLLIANDRIGVHNNFQISSTYAYKVKIDRKKTLSIGLQGGVYQNISNYTEIIDTFDGNFDPAFNELLPQNLNAVFGTGLFYYSKDFYLGFSIQNIETQRVFNNSMSFLTSAKTFHITNNVVIQPGFLASLKPNEEFSADLFANLILNDVIWFGVAYRTFNSINILSQLQITPQIRFAYSYGTPTNGLSQIRPSTHEIMLKYRFSFYRARVVTPRYF